MFSALTTPWPEPTHVDYPNNTIHGVSRATVEALDARGIPVGWHAGVEQCLVPAWVYYVTRAFPVQVAFPVAPAVSGLVEVLDRHGVNMLRAVYLLGGWYAVWEFSEHSRAAYSLAT